MTETKKWRTLGTLASGILLLALPALAVDTSLASVAAGGPAEAPAAGENWSDNFDGYAAGSQMHGQGGWKGWANDPNAGALVSTAQAHSPLNSVEILGASDLVHEYSGHTGSWVFTAWQYIPSAFTGQTFFILLNSYDDAGTNLNWSAEVQFDGDTDTVINDGVSGGTLPMLLDQWVELRVVIDLAYNTQTFYYGGQVLYTGTWTEELSGGGAPTIAAVDLFANGSGAVYYDDISLLDSSQVGGNWIDHFDTYAAGSQIHGQGNWKGWFNDPNAGALVSTAQARSPLNSVEVLGATDLVHEYSGHTGTWVYTAHQYIPTGFSGESYFIMLNSYDDAGANMNWSVQVDFNSATGTLDNTGLSGGSLPILFDQWVEIRVVIDLVADVQTFYYGGQMLYTGTWSGEVSGGGVLEITAVDLFANTATAVYYDDISLSNLTFVDGFETGDTQNWHSTLP